MLDVLLTSTFNNTTTCPQRRFLVDEQRKLGFDGLKVRMAD